MSSLFFFQTDISAKPYTVSYCRNMYKYIIFGLLDIYICVDIYVYLHIYICKTLFLTSVLNWIKNSLYV